MTQFSPLLPWTLGGAILLLVIIGGAILFRWRMAGFRKGMDALLEKQTALTSLVAELQAHMVSRVDAVTLNVALQRKLVQELTHFHTPTTDKLLAKLEPFTLTNEEEVELLAAMKDREVDMDKEITDSERDAAHMLPYVIKRVKEEVQTPQADVPKVFQIVSTPAPPPEEEEAG